MMQSSEIPNYRGRFAPSPTGPLHFGSLLAAVGSYCQARSQHGQWLVRIEDIDPPRMVPGADTAILRSLECYGLHWDGEIVYQSTRSEAYRHALDQLQQQELIYPCSCSRKHIASHAKSGKTGYIYPGYCRSRHHKSSAQTALRLITGADTITFTDALQGDIHCNVQNEIGDFVLYRADGMVAYQLAVVVDDAWQNITHVVRGSDLLFNTPMQIYLQQLLALPRPEYLHLPILINNLGQKLSKQNLAPALPDDRPVPLLFQALTLLGQAPDPVLREASVEELMQWACAHWRVDALPTTLELGFDYT